MNNHRWTIEHALFAAAFLLALGVRFLDLGAAQLPDAEARWAIQALQISGQAKSQAALGGNPGYIMITGLLFFLFGSANALARFLPALAGALLALAPVFFQPRLGKKAALILAFALALDPGMVAISRTAGSLMPALAFGLVALGAAFQRKAILAGILGGLALISGAGVIYGAVGIALAWGAGRLLERAGLLAPLQAEQLDSETITSRSQLVRQGAYFMAGTALLGGTLFFFFPGGLGGLATTLADYFSGWVTPSGTPASRLLAALLVYSPIALVFGIAAIVQGWTGNNERSNSIRWLSLWAVIALLLALIYPGRQVADVAWTLAPLWALAALAMAPLLEIEGSSQNALVLAGQAVLLFVLLAFAWNYLLFLVNGNSGLSPQAILQNILVLLIGAILMIAMTTILVTLGWSWDIARRGLSWGILAAASIYTLSALVGAAGLRSNEIQEMWYPGPLSGDHGLLMKTLGDLSEWKTGNPNTMDVTVLVDLPSLRWALRNWPGARFTTGVEGGSLPSAIIATKEPKPPALPVSYRGQDFVWEYQPAWQDLSPSGVPRWLAFRQIPRLQEEVILWARGDLFPGGSLVPQPNQPQGQTP